MPDYVALLQEGAFAAQVDPFAERGRTFQQIHSNMLNHFSRQLTPQLLARDYYLVQEASLQVAQGREPDLSIFADQKRINVVPFFDYAGVAAATGVDIGTAVLTEDPPMFNLSVYQAHQLVCVFELISPRNKANDREMLQYRAARAGLIMKGIHVVEMDLTRSVKRLYDHELLQQHPYHVIYYFADGTIRIVPLTLGQPFRRIGIPLRDAFAQADMSIAYRDSYEIAGIAAQLLNETAYRMEELPFPTLLSDEDKQRIENALQTWQTALNAARSERT